MPGKNKTNKIDRYIFHEMEEQERIDFEKEMQENESLRKEVTLMQHISVSFERKGEQPALKALKSIASEEELKAVLFKPAPQFRKLLISVASVAACVLLVLTYGFSPKYASQQLFGDYFLAETFEIMPGRGDISPIEQQNEALFSEALELLENDSITTAIESLTYLSSVQDFEYREETEWLLALVYLKQNNKQKATDILSGIIENNSFYASKAAELRQKINQRKWF